MAQTLIIQPRLPNVVQAKELLENIESFDRLFPTADVIDFTGLGQSDQVAAMRTYMAMYKCEGEYKKLPIEEWSLRRLPDRKRRDYYWAALCENSLEATHNLLVTGDWDERFHQTNILVVSNPEISQPYLDLKLTGKHGIRFDYIHKPSSTVCNIAVLPAAILDGLIATARQQLVAASMQTLFIAGHDDGHSIINSVNDEGKLRAMTAAMFRQMPLNFQQEVVQLATDSLALLDEPNNFAHNTEWREQTAFWHGSLIYPLQYLFEVGMANTPMFVGKLLQQANQLGVTVSNYQQDILSRIHGQIGRDEPKNIHLSSYQDTAVSSIRKRVAAISGRLILAHENVVSPVNSNNSHISNARRIQSYRRNSQHTSYNINGTATTATYVNGSILLSLFR